MNSSEVSDLVLPSQTPALTSPRARSVILAFTGAKHGARDSIYETPEL